ncbi:MAG: precorrin-2 C(20)-methyltransferase, partial [Halochromatium sp.]
MNTDREPTRTRLGRLLGASLGPGDPGLITRAAWEALTNADGWAWPVSGSGPSHALEIARRAGLEPPARSLALLFPMTRDAAALEHAWTEAATEVATRLRTGADLAFLVEGDASTHSTFGHLARALRALEPEARIEVIAGVPSFVAAAAASGATLADGDETIAICAAPRAMRELDAWLARADSLVLLKVRPVLDALIDALTARGLLDQAMFIDRLGTPQERIVTDLASLRGEPVHYLSLVLIRRDHGRGLGRARDEPASDPRRPMVASEKAPGSAPDVAMEGARKSAAARTPKEAQEEAPEDAPGMASGTPAETLIVALTEPGARLAAHLAGRLVAPLGGFAPGAVVPPALRADLDAGPGAERRASPLAHSSHGEDQARVRVRVPEHLRQVAHAGLSEAPERIRLDTHDGPLAAPVARFFEHARRADAPCRLIFIGAAGLIVRLIAPHLRDKRSDPAVLVVDEASRFVVPLLAGHLGGANAFGRRLAGLLGAQLVLTTASDVQGTIAVDILGRELGWRVEADAPALLRAASCVVNARPVVLIEEACGREWWTGPGAPPANIRCRPSLEAALAQGLEDACAVLWVTHRAIAADLAARLGERLVVYRPPAMAAADSRS